MTNVVETLPKVGSAELETESIEEQLSIEKKLTLTALPLERICGESQASRTVFDAINRVLEKTDGLITEYFPDELIRTKDNPVVAKLSDPSEAMCFSGRVMEMMKKQAKIGLFPFRIDVRINQRTVPLVWGYNFIENPSGILAFNISIN